MGLDTTSYSTIIPMPPGFKPTGTICSGLYCYDNFELTHISSDYVFMHGGYFPRSVEGIPKAEWYHISGEGPKTHSSYSGHSEYRNALMSVWTDEDRENAESYMRYPLSAPFLDLIWFSDCEGILGPEALRRLANDYIDYGDRVVFGAQDHYLENRHTQWRAAVAHASPYGVILFA